MVDALQTGPILCRILKDEGFARYKEGIYRAETGSGGSYEYLAMVGYGSEDGVYFWIGRSAYGSKWGNKGFIKLVKGKNALKVESYCAYAVPSNVVKKISKDTQKVIASKDINEISFEDYKIPLVKEKCGQVQIKQVMKSSYHLMSFYIKNPYLSIDFYLYSVLLKLVRVHSLIIF